MLLPVETYKELRYQSYCSLHCYMIKQKLFEGNAEKWQKAPSRRIYLRRTLSPELKPFCRWPPEGDQDAFLLLLWSSCVVHFCFIRMPKKKDMTIFVLVHAGTRWQGSVFVPLTQQYCVSRTNVCLSIICHCQEDLCCLVNQVEQTRETLMDYAEEILTKFWVHEVKGHAGTDTRLDRHSSTFSLTSKFPQC